MYNDLFLECNRTFHILRCFSNISLSIFVLYVVDDVFPCSLFELEFVLIPVVKNIHLIITECIEKIRFTIIKRRRVIKKKNATLTE